jgi:hypothetical protein
LVNNYKAWLYEEKQVHQTNLLSNRVRLSSKLRKAVNC